MSTSPRCCSPSRARRATDTGGEGRIKAARFPAQDAEEFHFTFQRSLKKTVIEHLGQLDFLHAKQNVILLGPPKP
jgi:DNA replication protein DnaC